jgi:outer membrane receptor protein involved in Fe transport
MRKIFITLIAVIASFASFAQTGKVTGSVEDGSQKIIESATITLLRINDSSIAKVAAADKAGKFGFDNIQDGKYVVSITAVGHQKAYSPAFDINASTPSISLKTITLVPHSNSLSGVTVSAKKPLIEQRIDRTIVNVDASPTNVGSSALEVLEKSPGISVDKDGNVSLKGKAGVMILVDGRPTQLGGADLANLLRNMNANQLDQIEIMTNPPAKYDAAGNAGIINIKTKKNKQFGYNGSLTLGYGQGRYPKFNEGFNFNYRQGKFNVFTNLSHNYRKNFQELDIQRKFRDKSSKELISSFDQEARMKNEGNFYNGKVGLDYFANKTTTFGVVVSGFSGPHENENRNVNDIYNTAGQLTEITRALSTQKETWKNFSTNLNFRKQLDTAGKELTADLDYIRYDGGTDQMLTNSYFTADEVSSRKADTLFGHLPQRINIYSGKLDYVHPLKKGARFEAGFKSSYVKTDNNAVYDTVHNGTLIRDLNRSNHFIYEENINAAYVNLSGSISKKVNAQLGLRAENTIAKGKQITTSESFSRNYTQLFPTAFVQYKASEKNSFGLNYGRRIRRPNYESLNPFIEYLDRYTYQQGNPNLKPQFSHNVELSHTYKNWLTTTMNFTQTNDIIQQVIQQDELKNETYVKQANIAKQRQYGLAVSANLTITKWWTGNIYVNGFNNHYEGIVNEEPISLSATTLMINGTQQFKLNKTLSAELSGWFRSGFIEGVIEAKSMGALSVGFSQQVLKGNGTLRLNVRDVLGTQRFRGVSKYGSVDAAFQNRWDSRAVNVGFTYRFNKGKMNGGPKKKTGGGANDEQSRVGGSNGN